MISAEMMMFRIFFRSRSASIHCAAREVCAVAGALAIVCGATGASTTGSGFGGGGGGSALRIGEDMTGGAGWDWPLNCSINRRISSAPTFRPADPAAGTGGGMARGPAGCGRTAGRGTGGGMARGCSRGRGGICGLGRVTGGGSPELDESSSVDCCSLVQPLTRATTTKMISQMIPSMFASLTVLTRRAGFTGVFS